VQILGLAGIMMPVDSVILFKIKIKVDDFMKASKKGNLKKHICEGVACDLSASILVPQELRWRRNISVCLELISLPCFVELGDRSSVECCFCHAI